MIFQGCVPNSKLYYQNNIAYVTYIIDISAFKVNAAKVQLGLHWCAVLAGSNVVVNLKIVRLSLRHFNVSSNCEP